MQFPSNRSQHVMVDGCRNNLVNVVSGLPLGSVLEPLLFLLYTSDLFSIMENNPIRFIDDSTLIAVVPFPSVRESLFCSSGAAESLNRDLGEVSESSPSHLWGMKLNESMTKTMIVSMSRTMHPQSPLLTIGRTVLMESDDLDILGDI